MRTFILALLLLFGLSPFAGASPVMTDRLEGSVRVLSHASWLEDPTGAMGIAEASAPPAQGRYASLRKGFSATAGGAGWLRLELAKTPPAPGVLPKYNDNQLFLALGALPPGKATMYRQNSLDPVSAPGFWYATTLRPYEDAALPEPPLSGTVVYIHFEETPGLWFSPAITRSGDTSPFVVPPDLVLPGLLLAGIIVCLLRAIKDRALWPVWAALMLGLVLVQVLFPLPITRKRLDFASLPPLLAPGLCLMIFPHLGRLMLNTRSYSTLQDSLLKVTPVMGVILSLAPLVPGYGWLARLFPLWPLFLTPLLPFCFSALSRKRPGALVYTGACLLPVIGSSWALWSLFTPEIHPLAAYGGLWGLAVGGLFLFLARVPKEEQADARDDLTQDNTLDAGPAGEDSFLLSLGNPHAGQSEAFAEETAVADMNNADHEATTAPFSLLPDSASQASNHAEAQSLPLRHLFHDDDNAPPSVLPSAPSEENQQPEVFATTEQTGNGNNAESEAGRTALEEARRKYDTSVPEQREPSFAPFGDASADASTKAPVAASFGTGTYGGMAALFNEGPEPVAPPTSSVASDAVDEEKSPAMPHAQPNETGDEAVPAASNETTTSLSDAPFTAPAVSSFGWSGPAAFPDDDAAPAEEPVEAEERTEPTVGGSRFISLEDDDFNDPDWQRQASLLRASMPAGKGYVFSLHGLVRDVHDAAMPLAEDKGILLSWFISPSLPSFLEGDAASLRQALSLLLQNAVQATPKGAVQLFVRHDPAAPPTEQGRLQFTVSDTGAAQRADAGFFHAWELAQRTGGSFSIEYSVTGGTLVVFSVAFSLPSEELLLAYKRNLPEDSGEHSLPEEQAVDSREFPRSRQLLQSARLKDDEEDGEEEPLPDAGIDASVPRFIITDMTTSNKRLLSHYLSDIPHVALESRNMEHAVELVRRTDPALVIYDADAPEDAICRAIENIAALRERQGRAFLPQLVIAGHETQAKRMRNGGATHVLLKPFTPEALVELLREALPTLEEEPALSPEATKGDEPAQPRVRVYLQSATPGAAYAGTGISVPTTKKEPAPEATPDTSDILPQWADEATPVAEAPSSPTETHSVILPAAGEDPSHDLKADAPAEPLQDNTAEGDGTASSEPGSLMDLFITEEGSTAVERAPGSSSGTAAVDDNELPPTVSPLQDRENAPEQEVGDPPADKQSGQGGLSDLPEQRPPHEAADPEGEEKPIRPRTISVVEPVVVNLSAGAVTSRVTPLTPVEETSEATTVVASAVTKANDADSRTADQTDSDRKDTTPDARTPSSVLEEAGDMLFGPAPTGSYPLPGMGGEALEVVMLPLVPGLLHTLNDALADSIKARDEHQTIFVQEAVSRLAGKAEVFGLERLGKIARCVERAAEADDFEAVDTLLDDLITVTRRYIESLRACYDSFVNEAR